MSQEALKYLQSDAIGKVVAKGLAKVYQAKPERPVKFLAEWLRNYSRNRQQLSGIVQAQVVKDGYVKIFEQTNKVAAIRQQQLQRQAKRREKVISDFKQLVSKHEYQAELLQEVLPEFVQSQTEITGAYIGELNYPPKQINDEDTDQQAHLNTTAERVINYIGSSVSHRDLMRGKLLKLSEGVTAAAFSLAEEPSVPATGDDGQEVAQSVKEKYIYIPNVVKNESMHYFRIPKLGAYLAVPLVCQTFLKENIFDEALAAKVKQNQEKEEFERKKKQDLEQLNKSREELAKKIQDLTQKHADQSQIQTLNAELSTILMRISERELENYQETEPELTTAKNSYVFCLDNLGRDKQLNPKDIALITELVDHFKNSWEAKEKLLLAKDVETQVELLSRLPAPPLSIYQQLQKVPELDEQFVESLGQIQNEQIREYKQQQEQHNRLKKQINANGIYLESFLNLRKFRVVKFKQVIQHILYFLGHAKKDVNLPGKTILDWKKVHSHYITEETFNSIINFVVQGPKEGAFAFYRKTPFLLSAFEKFKEDEIFSYNVGLGAVAMLITKTLQHRVSNVELRKAQKQVEKQERASLIEQNEVIEAEKLKALEVYKLNLAPEEVEGFKQQQWVSKYESEHPKKEIPPQVIDDIDNDI